METSENQYKESGYCGLGISELSDSNLLSQLIPLVISNIPAIIFPPPVVLFPKDLVSNLKVLPGSNGHMGAHTCHVAHNCLLVTNFGHFQIISCFKLKN